MITWNLVLDLHKESSPLEFVKVRRGDIAGTYIEAQITDNGGDASSKIDGTTCYFCMTHPDGVHYTRHKLLPSAISGSTVSFYLDETWAAPEAGRTDNAYLQFEGAGGDKFSTASFSIVVLAGVGDDADTDTSYDSIIDEALRRLVSPTVTFTPVDGGVLMTVTDKDGSKSVTIYNGAPDSGAQWYPHEGGTDGDYLRVLYSDDDGTHAVHMPTITGGSGPSGVTDGKIDSRWLNEAGMDTYGAVKLHKNETPTLSEVALTGVEGQMSVPLISGEAGNRTIAAQYLPLATSESKGAISAADKGKLDNIGSDYIVTSASMTLEEVAEDEFRQRVKMIVARKNASDEWEQVTYYLPYAATASSRIQADMLPDSGVVAGSYGTANASAYYVPRVTVDDYGRVTQATSLLLPDASGKQHGLMTISQYNDVLQQHVMQTTIAAGDTGATLAFVFVGTGRVLDVQVRDSAGNPVGASWSSAIGGTGNALLTVTLDSAQADVTYVSAIGSIRAVSK